MPHFPLYLSMKIVPTILAMTIFLPGLSQNDCNESSVIGVTNANFKPLPYNPKAVYINPKTGNYFGCGPTSRGEFCNLIISKAFYDKDNCELQLEGHYVLKDFIRRSQPYNYRIFLAERKLTDKGPVLVNVRELKEVMGETMIGYSDGYFSIKFCFTASDRLYFDAGQHVCLTEYNVGCLLQWPEFAQPLNLK